MLALFRRHSRARAHALAAVAAVGVASGLAGTLVELAVPVLLGDLKYSNTNSIFVIGAESRDDEHVIWNQFAQDIQRWRGARTTAAVGAYGPTYHSIAGEGAPRYAEGAMASTELLAVLGIRPIRGRWFDVSDRATNVVVIDEAIWRSQFGASEGIIGRSLLIDGRPHTVIGVLPSGFCLPRTASYWLPWDGGDSEAVARVNADADIRQAVSELASLSERVRRSVEARRPLRLVAVPLRERLFGDAKPTLRLLAAAAALVWLIGCGTVANFALIRSTARRDEFAVRSALGASRSSLLWLVILENATLALAAIPVSALLAAWASSIASSLVPSLATYGAAGSLSGVAGLLAATASAVLSVALGALPHAVSLGDEPQVFLLRRGPGAVSAAVQGRKLAIFAIMQVATALVMVLMTIVLLRSIAALTRPGHLGFEAKGLVALSVDLSPNPEYAAPLRRIAYTRDLVDGLRAVPSVTGTAVGPLPLVAGADREHLHEGFDAFVMVGDDRHREAPPQMVWIKAIDENYVQTYQMSLAGGRSFLTSDDGAAPRVAMLNRAAADLIYHDADPIGSTLDLPGLTRRLGASTQVVGIVDDVLQRDPMSMAEPEIYVPVSQQDPGPSVSVVLRSRSYATVVREVRQVLYRLDPTVAPVRLEPLEDIVRRGVARQRFLFLLLSLSGTVALALCLLSVYTIVSYLATLRRRELALRVALGAPQRRVVALAMREGVTSTGLGVAAGVAIYALLRHGLDRFVLGALPDDSLLIGMCTVALFIAGCAAALSPAWRVVATDPMQVLREE